MTTPSKKDSSTTGAKSSDDKKYATKGRKETLSKSSSKPDKPMKDTEKNKK